LGPGGVYDGSGGGGGGGGGLGPGGVYDGSGGQPIYINEDRIDAISVQSNVISNRLLHLANESGTPTGQLISEWLFDVLNFPKKTTQTFDEFLPKNLEVG
jgi:hypothetical protein